MRHWAAAPDGRRQLKRLLPSLVFLAGRHRSPDSFQGKGLVRSCAKVCDNPVWRTEAPPRCLCSLLGLHTLTYSLAHVQGLASMSVLAPSTPQLWWLSDNRSVAWVERLRFDREATVRSAALTTQGGMLKCLWGRVQLVHGADDGVAAQQGRQRSRAGQALVESCLRLVLSDTEPVAVRAAAGRALTGYVAGCAVSAASSAAASTGAGAGAGAGDAAVATTPVSVVWLQSFRSASFFSRLPGVLATGAPTLVQSATSLVREMLSAAPTPVSTVMLQTDVWPHLLGVLDLRVDAAKAGGGNASDAIAALQCAHASVLMLVRHCAWLRPGLRRYFAGSHQRVLARLTTVLASCAAHGDAEDMTQRGLALMCGGLLLLADLVRPATDAASALSPPAGDNEAVPAVLRVLAAATAAERPLPLRAVGVYVLGCLASTPAWVNAVQAAWSAPRGTGEEGGGDGTTVGASLVLNTLELYMALVADARDTQVAVPAAEYRKAARMLGIEVPPVRDGGSTGDSATACRTALSADAARALRAVLELGALPLVPVSTA